MGWWGEILSRIDEILVWKILVQRKVLQTLFNNMIYTIVMQLFFDELIHV